MLDECGGLTETKLEVDLELGPCGIETDERDTNDEDMDREDIVDVVNVILWLLEIGRLVEVEDIENGREEEPELGSESGREIDSDIDPEVV
ncbi:hypothetical protein PHLCEN_2v5183 [Hermanssonia centrifuga]|uniref:Uncharacterized protein n=1 Tax=Hermanssonia centrifuga TaxID=98765 RepID=A0A2R6P8V4_9APHY|nr:hypothetical protein PHLCEN_2v5183 [Hermanssonia centrifuga]